MKLVIDIPEEEYEFCKKQWDTECLDILTIAVKYGIPLPKGHGRLIDADELYKQDKEGWLCPQNAPFISTDYAHVFAEIDQAPTIIESDKED